MKRSTPNAEHFRTSIECMLGELDDEDKRSVNQAARVLAAAAAGGAHPQDLLLTEILVVVGIHFGHLTPVIEAHQKRMAVLKRLNSTPHQVTNRSGRKSVKVPMSATEREKIRALDRELVDKYPVPAKRYDAIAKRLGIKFDRVRYGVTGPRRTKR